MSTPNKLSKVFASIALRRSAPAQLMFAPACPGVVAIAVGDVDAAANTAPGHCGPLRDARGAGRVAPHWAHVGRTSRESRRVSPVMLCGCRQIVSARDGGSVDVPSDLATGRGEAVRLGLDVDRVGGDRPDRGRLTLGRPGHRERRRGSGPSITTYPAGAEGFPMGLTARYSGPSRVPRKAGRVGQWRDGMGTCVREFTS
jgi:hypothetical protein